MKIYNITNQDGLVIIEQDMALVVDGVSGLEEVRNRIDAYLGCQVADGEIEPSDPILAKTWISSKDVWRDHPEVARSTLSQACREGKILGATSRGREWWFPRLSFQAWTKRTPKPRMRKGKRTREQVWAKALEMTKADLAALA